ncbi:peptidase domain-containing ABC transporter [Dactylosporangium darangshiense]|uniref:NHLP family bacteriocin export ABC transporter peptidase/permease/ATPase subunit n=1 Tax=Dactylosporangium darangshiense TaxID=579108 RepID=A0ABP8DD96_9ACTN
MSRRRLPELRQVKAADCGAACLAMVLTYHGRPTTVRQMTADLGVSRDGLSALALVEEAGRYGLHARAFSLPPEELAAVPTPAVLYWNFNHYVLLERWGRRRVQLLDPVSGRRRLTREEFDVGYTGVVIGFEPGPDFRPADAEPDRPAWRRQWLNAALRRYRGLLAQVLLASVLLQVLGLAVPALSAVLVDRLLPTGATDLLAPLGLAVAVAVAAHVVLGFLRTALLLTLRSRADDDVTGGVVRHLFALPYRFFAERGSGDLVMRTQSVAALRDILSGHVLSTLLDAPLALGYLGLVLWRDPVFGGFLAALACVQLTLLLATRRRVADLAERELHASGKAQAQLIEALSGIETLKAASAEERAVQRWSYLLAGQLNAGTRHGLVRGGLETALGALQYLAPALLLLIGAQRVLHGELSLGTMLALSALATAALAPLSSIVDNLHQLQQTGAHLARLDDILDEAPEEGGRVAPAHDGRVSVRDLGFRFDPRAPWVLRGLTFTVEPGQKVAFVGRSGSGKSTLARLLLGLYQPTEGHVYHGRHDAATLDVRTLRRQFGVVTQDPTLFTGSVRENISLTDPQAPLSRVAAAAAAAGIHDDVMAMPMGYDTLLVDGGGLSGGQRQRIALARALLPEPRVLLLDEATSNLDPATEAYIERELAELPQTRIVIAHRLSTVRDADVIYVLDGGRIVEQGGHDELLALGGRYAQLAALQSVAG